MKYGNMKNVKNKVFLGFDLQGGICIDFHGHICNQQIEIRRYMEFQGAARYFAFGSTPRKSEKNQPYQRCQERNNKREKYWQIGKIKLLNNQVSR